MAEDVLAADAVFVPHERIAANNDIMTPVDVRSPDEYRDGHFPGAVNLPFSEFRDDGGADIGKLPGADRFATLVGEHGITPDDTLVAYDDSYGVYAARFLVTALVYDHQYVHVSDGDFTAWTADHPTVNTVPESDSISYPVNRLDDPPVHDSEAFSTVVDSDAVIVDTRIKYEYQVAHIPGAIQLNWRRFVDDDTRRLKPTDEIKKLLSDNGVDPDQRIALYCNTARRLSFTYAVLKHVGYDDVVFYEGGLPDWTDTGGDIETGH